MRRSLASRDEMATATLSFRGANWGDFGGFIRGDQREKIYRASLKFQAGFLLFLNLCSSSMNIII
jgi:hypothetical protein